MKGPAVVVGKAPVSVSVKADGGSTSFCRFTVAYVHICFLFNLSYSAIIKEVITLHARDFPTRCPLQAVYHG